MQVLAGPISKVVEEDRLTVWDDGSTWIGNTSAAGIASSAIRRPIPSRRMPNPLTETLTASVYRQRHQASRLQKQTHSNAPLDGFEHDRGPGTAHVTRFFP